MYDYRARIYNPTLGRFMQADPIGYEGGPNLYTYVGNDPVNFTDPLGLDKSGKQEFVGKIKWVDKGWGKSFGNPGFGLQKEVRDITISKDSRTGLSTKTIGRWTPVTGEGGGFGANAFGRSLHMASGSHCCGGDGASGSWESEEELAARRAYRLRREQSLPSTRRIPDPAIRLLNAIPTGSALKGDLYHRAAAYMLHQAAFFGRHSIERGGDGSLYNHYRLDSGIDGRAGTFHYILDQQGRLTHQQFEPGE